MKTERKSQKKKQIWDETKSDNTQEEQRKQKDTREKNVEAEKREEKIEKDGMD